MEQPTPEAEACRLHYDRVRRSLLEKEQAVVHALMDRLDDSGTPQERAVNHERLRMALTSSWQTADACDVRPSVQDEFEHIAFYLAEPLYRALGWTEAGLSLALGVLLFAAMLPLAMRGWFGGGDVKLISAMAVGLAPHETWLFIVATVFAGGVLGVAYIVARNLVPETRVVEGGTLLRRVLAVEAWRVRRRGPLPYAVAIATGGLIVLYTQTGI